MKISDNITPLPDGVWKIRFDDDRGIVVFLAFGNEVKVLKSDDPLFSVGVIEPNDGWAGLEFNRLFSVKLYYEITSKS